MMTMLLLQLATHWVIADEEKGEPTDAQEQE